MKVISSSIFVALAQSELDESGLLQHQTSASRTATMRGDDVYSYDRAELRCVDCPEFVALTEAGKKARMWAHIISDEYKDLEIEDRPWLQTYKAGDTYKCYGKERQNSRRRPGSWKSVTGQRTCSTRKKSCDCSDDFPNGKAWLDPASRYEESQGRVTNGTQPMFVDRFSDVNPAGNLKTIHSFGAVAQVRVETTSSMRRSAGTYGYTGMFRYGFNHGLLRLSMVTDFSKAACQPSDKSCLQNGPSYTDAFKPSLALKMFRDREESSNLVAQVNLGMGVGHKANDEYGIPAWENSLNFFKFTQSTWLPKPSVAVVGVAAGAVKAQFAKAVDAKEIGGVGIKELAAKGSKGGYPYGKVTKAPRMVFFVPTDEITKMKFSDADHDARHDFQKIPKNTPIYKIVALAEKDGCFMDDGEPYYWETLPVRCQGLHLGTVVTSSEFVASDWGDRRLFFQHERLKTKNGIWQRTMCSTRDGKKLPDTSEFRMASDLTKTCSVVFKGKKNLKCGPGMVESKGASAVCPYAYMDEDSA